MAYKSNQIIKTFLLERIKEIDEITFFFHPDNNDGEIEISIDEHGDYDTDINLPELKDLIAKSNLDTYDENKYLLFKNHIESTIKALNKHNVFAKKNNLSIYTQHIDKSKEAILSINKKNIFPLSQNYTFNLQLTNQKNEKKWWKVIPPLYQEDRAFQNLNRSEKDNQNVNFYSDEGLSLRHLNIKNLALISELKLKKLWDYEASDLEAIFSNRFCEMLNQIGVKNIEYYPLAVTCNTTGDTSSSYYKLANIVGLIEGVYLYEKSDFEKGIDTLIKNRRFAKFNTTLKIEKEVLNSCKEKIVRCKAYPEIFIVDNDIKIACEINAISGIEFEEVHLLD